MQLVVPCTAATDSWVNSQTFTNSQALYILFPTFQVSQMYPVKMEDSFDNTTTCYKLKTSFLKSIQIETK